MVSSNLVRILSILDIKSPFPGRKDISSCYDWVYKAYQKFHLIRLFTSRTFCRVVQCQYRGVQLQNYYSIVPCVLIVYRIFSALYLLLTLFAGTNRTVSRLFGSDYAWERERRCRGCQKTSSNSESNYAQIIHWTQTNTFFGACAQRRKRPRTFWQNNATSHSAILEQYSIIRGSHSHL